MELQGFLIVKSAIIRADSIKWSLRVCDAHVVESLKVFKLWFGENHIVCGFIEDTENKHASFRKQFDVNKTFSDGGITNQVDLQKGLGRDLNDKMNTAA